MSHRTRSKLLVTLIAAWAVGVTLSVFALTTHATQAAPNAEAPESWPTRTQLSRDPKRPTLVVLAHPMCPCSRATLRELERLLARVGDRVATRVVFMRSLSTGADPRRSDLWRVASDIPGVVVSVDEGGALMHVFGATASGQTLLYGVDGALVFKGGITLPGGHEGDNGGRDAVEALIVGASHARSVASVFGCPLAF
ncbi:MAG: RedB protein [Polyangiales bacterium]